MFFTWEGEGVRQATTATKGSFAGRKGDVIMRYAAPAKDICKAPARWLAACAL